MEIYPWSITLTASDLHVIPQFATFLGSDGALCIPAGHQGHVLSGPYLNLAAGRYRVTLDVEAEADGLIDVYAGCKVFAERSMTSPALLADTRDNFGHYFWNDLSGLDRYAPTGLLRSARKVVGYRYGFLDPECCLDDGVEREVFRLTEKHKLFRTFLTQKLYCVRPTALRMPAETAAERGQRVPAGVKVFNAFDLPFPESISWAFASDAYIATIVSGLTLVTWAAGRPGVAHLETAHLSQMEFWGDVRSVVPAPVAPPVDAIQDHGHGAYCDYSIDPGLIVDPLWPQLVGLQETRIP